MKTFLKVLGYTLFIAFVICFLAFVGVAIYSLVKSQSIEATLKEFGVIKDATKASLLPYCSLKLWR